MRAAIQVLAAFGLVALLSATPSSPQSNANLRSFFRTDIGLNEGQIAEMQAGQPVTKALPSRTPDEIFLFGAVYINAPPDVYLRYAQDFDRLRTLPSYLAVGVFSNPPRLADLKGFAFGDDDIQALKNCKPGNCLIQAPASSIEALHQSIDWSAPSANEQVNQFLQKDALQLLLAYQRDGNKGLGVYNDKRNPTVVPQQFSHMFSYSIVLRERLPNFYQYLLDYPNARPAEVEDAFYWENVKFGLKPTLRIVHRMTLRGSPTDDLAYAIAEKQLYSSHYFETALDLSFCVRGIGRTPGFYLIMVMSSEQGGLTGVKGSVVRKAAVGRAVSSLEKALTTIRTALETSQ